MHIGSSWYPEHWPESRWSTDLALMRDANLTVARIGEYAWSRLEPREGVFELDWLERVITLAAEFGVRIVLSTPTDAPPAWLTQKYPETLRVDEDAKPTTHGGRRHFVAASAVYRRLSSTIASKLAERFGDHPNVIGWQIGNEFCAYSYDKQTHALFQRWLQEQYGSLDSLNRHWTTAYWCQEYSSWDQIPLPIGWHNPCLVQAYFHFMSQVFTDFQRDQINAIRKVAEPRQWITHNIHGYEELDFVKIIADADVAGWDPYPGGGGVVDPGKLGWTSDFCRTLKSRPHWILEAQPGLINWQQPNLTLPRGALRAMGWHFLGHGAEAIMFWQWRAPLGGQEQYHGTLLAADGKPRPWFEDVAKLAKEMHSLEPLLEGAKTDASIAVIYSYADQVAIKKQQHAAGFNALGHTIEFYSTLRSLGHDLDVIHPGAAFDRYPLLVAPHLHCLDDELTTKLTSFVQAGGHLLLGPRSGFKDRHNAMLPSRQPGTVLSELLGASVDEFFTLDRAVPVSGSVGSGSAVTWAEYFKPQADDVETLLTYGKFNGWIDDQPAMVTRRVGKGRITYLGACLDEPTMSAAMRWAVSISSISSHFPAPPVGVEVCRRVKGGRDLFVLINHRPVAQQVALPARLTDLLTGTMHEVSIDLPSQCVAVLSRPEVKL